MSARAEGRPASPVAPHISLSQESAAVVAAELGWHAWALLEWRAECSEAARLAYLNGLDEILGWPGLAPEVATAVGRLKDRAHKVWQARTAPPWTNECQTGWSTNPQLEGAITDHCTQRRDQ